MGRKERKRYDYREQVFELVESGRPLTQEEIAFVKEKFSGIGGLTLSGWHRGQFFTPQKVVQFIHAITGVREQPGLVLKPSVGGGAFFEGLPEELCTGIEFCHRTFRVARACYPQATLYNERAEEMFPFAGPSYLDGQFDYVIGNPPFGQKIEWGGQIAAGKVKKLPSEIVFMEIAYRAAKPGGKIALVAPQGLLASGNSRDARKWLMERCFVRAVISLPPETFYFSGTCTKTSILFLQRFHEGVMKDTVANYPVWMAICQDIGWDSRGRPSKKDDLAGILSEWRTFSADWEKSIEWAAPGAALRINEEKAAAETPPEVFVSEGQGIAEQVALF